MMRRFALLLALLTPVLSVRAETLVPAPDRIDDRTATLALAETLAARAETRTEALAAYQAWTTAHPDDAEAVVALARVESWTGHGGEAAARLEALARRETLTPAARVILAEAWVQTGRFAEAARAYDELVAAEKSPSADLLLAAGNAHLYAGSPAEALPYYRRATEAAPVDLAARRAFALALAWTGRTAEARPLLESLATALPADGEVSRALAAASVGDAPMAERNLALLRQRVAREPGNALAKADLADLLAARGHAAEARSLYDAARLQLSPRPGGSFDLRQARARLTWGDFYPAESVFRAALVSSPDNAKLRGELIGLLISMDRLERAEAMTLAWLDKQPGSPPATARLLEIQRKRHDTAAVAALLAKFPEEKSAPPDPASPAGRFADAGRDKVRADAFVRALTADADVYQAKAETLPATLVVPETASRLVEWSGLYASQGDFEIAVRCLRAARLADPEYFPAWLNLAEFLAITQHYDEADREFVKLAAAFPDNRQVLLKQARSLGWGRRYDDSLAAYEHLRTLNPEDPVPLLEQARVAGWAKKRDESARLYALRWQKPVDVRLAEALRSACMAFGGWSKEHATLRTWRDWAETPNLKTDYAHADEPFAATERFEAEFPALLADVPECLANDLKRIRLDLRADFLLQRAFWLENRAKQLAWDRRWLGAEITYDRLLAVVPGNLEARFDLSQVQAAQGLGDRERVTLQNLIALDANNRLAAHALFRRERRSEPLVFGQLDYYRERGRGELSSIGRLRQGVGGEVMADDRFKLTVEALRWRESPITQPGTFRARGFTAGLEGVPAEWLKFSADYTHKDNEQTGIGSVDTGGAQAWVPVKDAVKIGAGVEVREELSNEFAYFQGIRSTHRWLGAEVTFSRRFEVAGRIAAVDYADDNAGTYAWIAPAYTWTDHPRTFKTILTLEARDTDNANTYVYTGPTLTNIIHPYWTPQNYLGATLTLEWRHDLARDFFIGAQEHWYDLRLNFSASNDGNQGVSWSADYAREWLDRWVLRLGVSETLSEQWNDFRATARLAFRF